MKEWNYMNKNIYRLSSITFMVLFLILHIESIWNLYLYKEVYTMWHLLKKINIK